MACCARLAGKQRKVFCAAFGCGMFAQIVGLRREAHAERRLGQVRHIGQNVRVGNQLQRQRIRALLDLRAPGVRRGNRLPPPRQ